MRITDQQIERIISDLRNHLSDFSGYGVCDYECPFLNDIHVFIDFNPISCNGVDLKKIEVLNDDYDLLEKETLTLKPYVLHAIEEHNQEIENSLIGEGYSIAEELEKERYYYHKYATL